MRYTVTHYSKRMYGRILTFPQQGRYTWPTREEAQAHLDATRANNSTSTLNSIADGAPSTLGVRAVQCWPGHFDPVGCYAPESDPVE